MKLVKLPIEEYESIETALQLEHHQSLLPFFAYGVRRELAVDIARDVVNKDTQLTTLEHVVAFFELVQPLVKDLPEQPADLLQDEDFAEEQQLLGRFLALIAGNSLDVQYQVNKTYIKKRGKR